MVVPIDVLDVLDVLVLDVLTPVVASVVDKVPSVDVEASVTVDEPVVAVDVAPSSPAQAGRRDATKTHEAKRMRQATPSK